MNKKHLWKKTAALVLALGLTFGATGCEFVVSDNVKDLEQVVATVDITDELSKEDKEAAQVLDTLIADNALSTDVYKRDLVALFLSQGQQYVNYGYSYKDVFTMLVNSLTQRKILTQYAVYYFVNKGLDNPDADRISLEAYKTAQLNAVGTEEKALLESHPEVLTMKYYLTDFGSDSAEAMEGYYEAVYQLHASLNSSLDSVEGDYIKESGHTHSHDDTRTLPTNATSEKSDYVPTKSDGTLDYAIYTGRNALDTCGAYEKVEGSTKSTRMKAYNMFLYNLQSYGLIEEGEQTADITKLNYYYEELSSSLATALVNKYYDELKAQAEEKLLANDGALVQSEYAALLNNQKTTYDNDKTAFSTAMDSTADNAFLLYGMENYGYVYNILLPFSQTQSQLYSAAQNKYEEKELYKYREELLAKVVGKDLRGAWFCEEESEHYAYEKNGKYYFFEDNFTNNDRYETITQYAGNYAYNGTAELVDGEWECTPNTLTIDEFMTEFVNYVSTTAGVTAVADDRSATYGNYYNAEDEIDYSGFVYASGKFDFGTDVFSAADYFYQGTDATPNKYYQALSAVNELMFAYSTDTGCLNTYMGYSVNANKTSFVSEFEYAAQWAVQQGVGAYVVVPSDYGWHIIYCSYKFDGGEVYGGYDHSQRETEGTFSYYFYEALKDTSATTLSTSEQNRIVKAYEDKAVTLYTDRYQDLLDLDN